MKTELRDLPPPGLTAGPGETIRALRHRHGLTLAELSGRTGLAVSTLSKLEKGRASLSYDKLHTISRGLGVDMAELLDAGANGAAAATGAPGRRVVQRAGDGLQVETSSYRQIYLATELLNKRITPLIAELEARTLEAFFAEFGGFIRHGGEEFVLVLEGEVEFHTDLYAPVRLQAGDSVYFDSAMGHAYLKASDARCRVVAACAGPGKDEQMIGTFVAASARKAEPPPAAAPPARKRRR